MTTNERLGLIRSISRFLFISLALLIPTLVVLALQPWHKDGPDPEPEMAYIVLGLGALGAFVSLQRRLKSLSSDDLRLLAESWFHAWLSPLVGGILATVLYCLFLAGLLGGELFPSFCQGILTLPGNGAAEPNRPSGFAALFRCTADGPRDYAKLMFWSFLAGFSEKFVVDIIGHFESQGTRQTQSSNEPRGTEAQPPRTEA
jgi:hypothetical protein